MLMFVFYILSFTTSISDLPIEIKNRLEMKFSNYSRAEFEVIKAPKKINEIYFDKNDDINVIGSRAYIPIYLINKRGEKRRTTITVKVKLFEKVYISINDITRRDQINVSDFKLIEAEVTTLRGTAITSIGEIIGARAGRHIRKGDILTSESIESMPVIFPGDRVSVASVVGNVLISFNAISRQEGSVGDIIRIRTRDNEIFRAEVIDFKNVLIIE